MNARVDPDCCCEPGWARALLDAVPDVVFRYRLAEPRGFEYVNPAATELCGYTPDELYADPELGLRWVLDEDRAVLARLLTEGGDGRFLLRFRHKLGHVVWVEHRLTTVRDEDGAPVAIHGLARDVTAVRMSESLVHALRAALDQAPVSVMLTDPSGAIEYVNPAFTTITGYTAGEAIGRNPRFLKSGEVPAATYHDLWATLTAGQVWRGELINRRKDGSLFHEDAAIFPVVEESGKITGFCGVKEDITERQRLRAERSKSQHLEAIGRMAAGIAHDFNNVLAVVLGLSREVCDQMDPRDPRRQDLEDVCGAAERGASLARQLLALGSDQPRPPERLDLGRLASGMARLLLRSMTDGKALTFGAASDAAWALVDTSEIEQVLLNLVVNAREAIDASGHVELRVERDVARQRAVIVVTDDGPGMTAEVKRRVFEPFFTTKREGNGLGLATVFAIAQRRGGGVEIASEPGAGCEVRVWFPLA